MSRISDAILDTLLEEITDYDLVDTGNFNKVTWEQLQTNCDRWKDNDSIESEINLCLIANGYKYWSDEYQWVLPLNSEDLKYDGYVIKEGQKLTFK